MRPAQKGDIYKFNQLLIVKFCILTLVETGYESHLHPPGITLVLHRNIESCADIQAQGGPKPLTRGAFAFYPDKGPLAVPAA
ncbi:hypothetical protein MB02_10135 [Croceicoccus estronivorus]|nr:hypothetical protein MB02_10135 [Croceicoccus estronivorus]